MRAIKRSGEAVTVATIQRRRRHVTDREALEIRAEIVAERHHGTRQLSIPALAKVLGLSQETVRQDLRKGERQAREAERERRNL